MARQDWPRDPNYPNITYSQEHLAEAARIKREWHRREGLKSTGAIIAFFVGLTLAATVFFGLVNLLGPGTRDLVTGTLMVAFVFWLGRRWERDHRGPSPD